MADTIHKSGLTNTSYLKLRDYTLFREGGGSYIPIDPRSSTPGLNRLGFAGGFQMGTMALKDSGYIKKDISNSNSELLNPANWRNADGTPIRGNIGSLNDFLNSPAAQNDAHLTYTNNNVRSLINVGLLSPNAPQEQIAGWAMAGQFGVGNLKKEGLAFVDGNGVSAQSYYNGGSGAVAGTVTVPPPRGTQAPGTNASVAGTTFGANANTPAGTGAVRNGSGTGSTGPSSLYIPMAKLGETGLKQQFNLGATAAILDVKESSGPLSNVLHSFVSFNPLFTFSSLTKDQINTSSFVSGDIGDIIFSSGGRDPDNRVETANKSTANLTGKFDFFIDNVEMDTLIAPQLRTKGTSVISLNFDLYEPYSMGVFLQACQLAAFSNGHINYAESPFLMTLNFLGYDESGRVTTVPGSTRYFPVRLYDINMEVTGSGCKYSVKCVAWGEVALADQHNILKQNVSISGKDVREMLQSGKDSLQYIINSRLQEMTKESTVKYLPDEVAIVFPKPGAPMSATPSGDKSATTSSTSVPEQLKVTKSATTDMFEQSADSVNKIGTATLEFDLTRAGLYPKIADEKVHDNGVVKRNLISAEVKGDQRQFVFQLGTSIVNAITEVVLMSGYCTAINNSKPDAEGMLDWFRIETQVYLQDSKDGNKGNGSAPKLLVYKVIPYKVHSSKMQAPTTTPPGYDELKKAAVKEYNYLYTGKNLDVLDFKINFKTGLFTKVYADGGKYHEYAADTNQMSQGGSSIAPKNTINKDSGSKGDAGLGFKPIGKFAEAWRNEGGSASDTYKTLVAKQFHYQLLSGNMSDMVTGELTLLGDPYFISDSGIGNFSNTAQGARRLLSPTGAMDYQSSEVDIVVNFRTPVDIGENGIMEFSKSDLEVPFSGLYQVVSVKSAFNRGKFIQTLELIRRLNQNPKVVKEYTPFFGDDISDPKFNTDNDVA